MQASGRRGALLCAICCALGAGCAGPAERGAVPVRPGAGLDGGLPDGALDLAVPDADVDAGVDVGPPPSRAVWLVSRAQPHADGLRAQLQPPHAPTGDDPAALLPEAALLVAWAGPADDPRLSRAWATERPVGVLYDLGDRLAGRDDAAERRALAVADVSGLIAALSAARYPLLWRERPLVLVDGPWDAAMNDAFAAARARADDLGAALSWGAIVDPTASWIADPAQADGPPDDLDPIVPRCAVADAAARSRARQWSDGHDAGDGRWLPCLAPPTNPRLDTPRAPADAPDLDSLRRRLVLARRVGAPVVIVDGAGAWRDDRQLDPVSGPSTGAPVSLTTAWVYRGYGTARVDAVRRFLLTPAGRAPGPLADPPVLLDLVRSVGVIVERLESTADGLALRLQDVTERGRYEVLLDDRPFVVTPGLALTYRRTDPAVAVDLIFEDGARLRDLLPDAGEDVVRRGLDPFVGRRVEEATLVYAGGRARLDARIVAPRIASPAESGAPAR